AASAPFGRSSAGHGPRVGNRPTQRGSDGGGRKARNLSMTAALRPVPPRPTLDPTAVHPAALLYSTKTGSPSRTLSPPRAIGPVPADPPFSSVQAPPDSRR